MVRKTLVWVGGQRLARGAGGEHMCVCVCVHQLTCDVTSNGPNMIFVSCSVPILALEILGMIGFSDLVQRYLSIVQRGLCIPVAEKGTYSIK